MVKKLELGFPIGFRPPPAPTLWLAFGWHRLLVAQKCDGSQQRKAPGRPTIDPELEALVVRMAQENRAWGYDRIVGTLANLGHTISDQTVGNILRSIYQTL
jgi:hypothetical protein